MRLITRLEDSELYQKLTDIELQAVVTKAARNCASLLGTVVRDMPLFTLHNEQHILNVITWMEALFEPGGIDRLGQ